MNNLRIDVNSWHYKLVRSWCETSNEYMPSTLCTYFWKIPKLLLFSSLLTIAGVFMGSIILYATISPYVTYAMSVYTQQSFFDVFPFHIYAINLGSMDGFDPGDHFTNWVVSIIFNGFILLVVGLFLITSEPAQKVNDKISSLTFAQVTKHAYQSFKDRYCPRIEYVDSKETK